MTPLPAIRDAALYLAEQAEYHAARATGYCREHGAKRARDLRHAAYDAQAALDGCEVSLADLTDFLAGDETLSHAASVWVGEAETRKEAA